MTQTHHSAKVVKVRLPNQRQPMPTEVSDLAPYRKELRKGSVTIASRIMLPTYVIHATWLGAVYTLDPQGRVGRSPALEWARELLTMWIWGILFLAIAAVMIVALLRHTRGLFAWALYAYAITMIMWTAVYVGALVLNHETAFSAPAWPPFVAVACIASAVSLQRGEI